MRFKPLSSNVISTLGCSCVPLPLDATSFENGYHLTAELVCSAVSEDEGRAVQHESRTHFTRNHRIHLHVVQDIQAERMHLQKAIFLLALLYLGLASNAAHKNQRVR